MYMRTILAVMLLFAGIYAMLGKKHFNFKHAIDPLYMSANIQSTVGFSGVMPVTQTAKCVVIVHQVVFVIGLLYIMRDLLN